MVDPRDNPCPRPGKRLDPAPALIEPLDDVAIISRADTISTVEKRTLSLPGKR